MKLNEDFSNLEDFQKEIESKGFLPLWDEFQQEGANGHSFESLREWEVKFKPFGLSFDWCMDAYPFDFEIKNDAMSTENKLLFAKFLNYDFSRFENDGIIERQEDSFFDIQYKSFSIDELNFDSDWNRLMEVVEKIERLRSGVLGMKNEEILAYITITENYCEVQTIECIFEPDSEDCTKIEAVYSTCLQFLKWYNSKPELQC